MITYDTYVKRTLAWTLLAVPLWLGTNLALIHCLFALGYLGFSAFIAWIAFMTRRAVRYFQVADCYRNPELILMRSSCQTFEKESEVLVRSL